MESSCGTFDSEHRRRPKLRRTQLFLVKRHFGTQLRCRFTATTTHFKMSDRVERAMEDTIKLMNEINRTQLLSREELTDVTRRRRNHEYRVLSSEAPRSAYLEYANFEKKLSDLLKERALERRGVKRHRANYVIQATAGRADLVYSRAVKRHKGDTKLWLHYARHRIEHGSHRSAAKVLGRALSMHPDAEEVWLAAIALHADTMGDTGGARKIAMRALRALPDSKTKRVFETYFRVELAFVCKSIARRVTLRVPIFGREDVPGKSDGSANEKSGDEVGNAKENGKLDDMDQEAKKVNGDDEGIEKEVEKIEEKQSDAEVKKEAGIKDQAHNEENEVEVAEKYLAETERREEPVDKQTNEGELKETDEQESSEQNESNVRESDNESSGESVTDGDDEIEELDEPEPAAHEPKQSLIFMRGGIPLAIFRQARNRLKLSTLELLEYLKVAVKMPYTPWELIRDIHLDIESDRGDEFLVKVTAARLSLDIALAKLNHIPPPQGLGTQKDGSAKIEVEDTTSYNAAKKVVELAAEESRSTLIEVLGEGNKDQFELVLPIVKDFIERAKDYADHEELKDLLAHAAAMKRRKGLSDEDDVSAMTLKEVAQNGTLAAWSYYLEKSKDMRNAERVKVRKALTETIAIPFRNDEKDQVAALWVKWEDDLKMLVECVSKIMALPPQSERFLRACAIALKRFLRTVEDERRSICIASLGKVYEKLVALPAAKSDIDLWIEYVEFERDTRMDNTKSSSLEWKAKKILSATKAELFTEKLCCRLLAQ